MRISYSCPAHLKFAMTIEQWTELVNLASECIDWLDAHEGIYDIWLIVAYAATSCALVQVPSTLMVIARLLTIYLSTIHSSVARMGKHKPSCLSSGIASDGGKVLFHRIICR